jgi:hypothetical protein
MSLLSVQARVLMTMFVRNEMHSDVVAQALGAALLSALYAPTVYTSGGARERDALTFAPIIGSCDPMIDRHARPLPEPPFECIKVRAGPDPPADDGLCRM